MNEGRKEGRKEGRLLADWFVRTWVIVFVGYNDERVENRSEFAG